MKTLCATLFTLALLLVTTHSHAGTADVIFQIPEKYALLQINGHEPGTPIGKDALLQQMKDVAAKVNVEHFQWILYEGTNKWGSKKPRALGEIFKDNSSEAVDFVEFDNPEKQANAETYVGYTITPAELWKIYDENEVVADDDYKGRPILFAEVVNKDGLAKDAMGIPYMKIKTDKHGLFGVHLVFKKDDPILRKLKKGQKMLVQCYPERFVMKTVFAKVSAVILE